ncbi:hypothetical protein NQ315_014246 [Exocentrus adspersus]|uniref:Uncharacterized protein n=1 Tax=Exocentrus adspersus TaxID=1586481 RepID=A0AAV8VAD4_9CUCU|nr:hypothetical protein NQ315_014246 [Exocentrus adspersus]
MNWDEPAFPRMKPNYECRKIFSNEEEAKLCDYLIKCGKLHHGLPPIAARKLAYDLAMANNKSAIYAKYPTLNASRIYNTDETALTTVQGSSKIIAQKGQRQIGQVTSSERGTLVTMCGTINAMGNCISPYLVFPRVHFKDNMI